LGVEKAITFELIILDGFFYFGQVVNEKRFKSVIWERNFD